MNKLILTIVSGLLISLSAIAQEQNYNSKAPVEITADKLEVTKQNQSAVFSGNVEAKQGNITIKSDKMMVYYTENKGKGTGGSSVSKVETTGNVILSTPDEKATSNIGIFEVAKNTIELSGNVVLTRGKNMVKGDKLLYNLTTGQSQLVSAADKDGVKKERVRGVFIPEN